MILSRLRIFPSPACVAVEVTWRIERHPTKKRRRNWRVVRYEKRKPCAYRLADGSVYVHPTIYARLSEASRADMERIAGTSDIRVIVPGMDHAPITL